MKKDEFRLLAEEVANCHLCENLVTLPHIHNSEYLENDDHGLDTDHPYINRWNLWQGNLDADIMVIGQDYGTKEYGNAIEVCKYVDSTNPTDLRLKRLFKEAFGIDVDSCETPLFFTNMAIVIASKGQVVECIPLGCRFVPINSWHDLSGSFVHELSLCWVD